MRGRPGWRASELTAGRLLLHSSGWDSLEGVALLARGCRSWPTLALLLPFILLSSSHRYQRNRLPSCASLLRSLAALSRTTCCSGRFTPRFTPVRDGGALCIGRTTRHGRLKDAEARSCRSRLSSIHIATASCRSPPMSQCSACDSIGLP